MIEATKQQAAHEAGPIANPRDASLVLPMANNAMMRWVLLKVSARWQEVDKRTNVRGLISYQRADCVVQNDIV
jgi:hypothetical protein